MRFLMALAGAALIVASNPAFAQKGAKKAPAKTAAAAGPSKAEVENASRTLGVLMGAMQSEKVPAPVKQALFGCLYQAPLGAISARVTAVLAQNKEKLNAGDASDRLSAIAVACGVRDGEASTPAEPKGR